MEWTIGTVFLLLLFIFVNQLVYGSSDAEFGQNKCFCPPTSPPPKDGSTPSYPGGGSSSSPTSPSTPPSGSSSSSPTTPTYSSPPPSGSGSSSPIDPPLTPPYTAPSTPNPIGSTPSYTSPPSPSSSSSPTPFTPPSSPTPFTPPSSPTPFTPPSYGTPPASSSSRYIPSPGADPSLPSTPDVTPPSVPDLTPDVSIPGIPGYGTGTCDFWGSHTFLFPDILSIFSSISDVFGSGSGSSGSSLLGNGMTVHEALRNKRKDGYGSLLRQGSASLLNSLVNPTFVFRPEEVRNQFNAALHSNTAAAVQGAKFKSANEGRLLP